MEKNKVYISKEAANELKKVISNSLLEFEKARKAHLSPHKISVYGYLSDVINYIYVKTKYSISGLKVGKH